MKTPPQEFSAAEVVGALGRDRKRKARSAVATVTRRVPTAEKILSEILAGVASEEQLLKHHAERLEEIRKRWPTLPRFLRSDAINRDLHTAESNLTSFRKWLERSRILLSPDPAADKREDDALMELSRGLARRKQIRDELEPVHKGLAPKPKNVGRPPLGEHFFVYGALAVNSLTNMGAGRAEAVHAVARSLETLMPLDRTLADKTLLQWMRQRGVLAPLPLGEGKP